jgi:hypothetical protein
MKILKTANYKKLLKIADTYETSFYTEDAMGNQIDEIPILVTYEFSRGYPQTQWEPEEFPEVDISSIIDKRTGQEVDESVIDENESMKLSEEILNWLSERDEGYRDMEADRKMEEDWLSGDDFQYNGEN